MDSLMQLVAHLQHDTGGAYGRRTLLEYTRRWSGAKQTLLFLLEQDRQVLRLLAQSQHPHDSWQHGPQELPLHGLFGSAIGTSGLTPIPDADANLRSLPEERSWLRGPVMLSAVGQETAQSGIFVLCFASQEEWQQSIIQTEAGSSQLLICITLLSTYLTRDGPPHRALPESERQALINQERSRIARDIHDGPAQYIAHGIHKLDYIEQIMEKQPQEALREIRQVRHSLEEGLNELRYDITSLLPWQLETQGLNTALRTLIDRYIAEIPELQVFYETKPLPMLPSALEGTIFHIIQEALNNVRHHANASQVTIRIRLLAGLLVVEVSDNGKGFQPGEILQRARATQHIGLRAMRERIQQAGGRWEIQSTPGVGTTIKARFPLANAHPLTNRERQVLQLLIEGATNRVIAEKLSVSVETIKSHVHHIMQKMQVRDRTQAAVVATKDRWV